MILGGWRVALAGFLSVLALTGCDSDESDSDGSSQEGSDPAADSPAPDVDGDRVPADLDCDDGDAGVGSRFTDADGDGYGTGSWDDGCADRGAPGYAPVDGDCADSDGDRHPGALELCDSIDNDCDGAVDDGLPILPYYRDLDGDGSGTAGDVVWGCSAPDGYAAVDGDCDDGSPTVGATVAEVCDGIDNDCDGTVDEPPCEIAVEFATLEEGETLSLDETLLAEVSYVVRDFTLAAPESCDGSPLCGHVHLLIDGAGGNQPDQPFNQESYASPVDADFSTLEAVEGVHTLTLELVDDDEAPVGLEASVTISVEMLTPWISIEEPDVDENLLLPSDDLGTMSVIVSTQAFSFASAGMCGSRPNCGHVQLRLDDADGDAPGASFNAEGATFELDAYLQYLVDNGYSATGWHTLQVELHHDDHTPYQEADGEVVGDSVRFSMTLPSDPRIEITNLFDGDSVLADTDGYKSVPLRYQVENFSMKAPGDCAGASGCGHVCVLIDGEDGNQPGSTCNHEGAGDDEDTYHDVDAHFYWIDYNGYLTPGHHSVQLLLHDDNHNPVVASGVEIQDDVALEVNQDSNVPSVGILDPRTGAPPHSEPGQVAIDIGLKADSGSQIDYVWALPGDCPPSEQCLHLRLFIDDDAGNLSEEQPYNAISGDVADSVYATMTADFSVLETDPFDTAHRVGIVVYHQDGTPYTLPNDDGTELEVGSWTYVTLVP